MLRMRHLSPLSALSAAVFYCAFCTSAPAQTIIDEWPSVTAPPAPILKSVALDPRTTGLLIMDLVKQSCNSERRPRCVASIPAIEKLIAEARTKGVMLIFTVPPVASIPDILPAVAPKGNEPVMTTLVPDKFQNTDLDKMLKDKGIKALITIGTAANAAVLYTASAAAMHGFNVIVPVDGMSGDTPYTEQFVAFNLANASIISPKITLTHGNMISFAH